ncbi:hypothetical protein ABLG96_14340 [Nakamurella sp. A5-74]|uniref:Uncharacterized protein n=1 Tax=Nakamurella sp. A5-74 TaxID=3158264 RepID=A0AAU8DJZ5_9ACTN
MGRSIHDRPREKAPRRRARPDVPALGDDLLGSGLVVDPALVAD